MWSIEELVYVLSTMFFFFRMPTVKKTKKQPHCDTFCCYVVCVPLLLAKLFILTICNMHYVFSVRRFEILSCVNITNVQEVIEMHLKPHFIINTFSFSAQLHIFFYLMSVVSVCSIESCTDLKKKKIAWEGLSKLLTDRVHFYCECAADSRVTHRLKSRLNPWLRTSGENKRWTQWLQRASGTRWEF